MLSHILCVFLILMINLAFSNCTNDFPNALTNITSNLKDCRFLQATATLWSIQNLWNTTEENYQVFVCLLKINSNHENKTFCLFSINGYIILLGYNMSMYLQGQQSKLHQDLSPSPGARLDMV